MLRKSLPLIALSLTVYTQMIFPSLVATAQNVNTQVSSPGQGKTQKFVQRRGSILKFKVPGIRPSGNLEAGAARGACGTENIQAVLPPKPVTMPETEVPIEFTLSDRPAFFISIPETSTNQGEFILQDETAKQILFTKKLRLTSNKGVVYYTIEPDFPGLEIGKKYIWQFSLICDPIHGDRSGDMTTRGLIKRVAASKEVSQQLQTTTKPRDRIAIYAENGYWNDTLKTLADLRAANPQDLSLSNDWLNLFKSVELETIGKQPISVLEPEPTEKP